MEVVNIEEQEDGGAIITLDISQEENDILIQYAVNDILIKKINEEKEENS